MDDQNDRVTTLHSMWTEKERNRLKIIWSRVLKAQQNFNFDHSKSPKRYLI